MHTSSIGTVHLTRAQPYTGTVSKKTDLPSEAPQKALHEAQQELQQEPQDSPAPVDPSQVSSPMAAADDDLEGSTTPPASAPLEQPTGLQATSEADHESDNVVKLPGSGKAVEKKTEEAGPSTAPIPLPDTAKATIAQETGKITAVSSNSLTLPFRVKDSSSESAPVDAQEASSEAPPDEQEETLPAPSLGENDTAKISVEVSFGEDQDLPKEGDQSQKSQPHSVSFSEGAPQFQQLPTREMMSKISALLTGLDDVLTASLDHTQESF